MLPFEVWLVIVSYLCEIDKNLILNLRLTNKFLFNTTSYFCESEIQKYKNFHYLITNGIYKENLPIFINSVSTNDFEHLLDIQFSLKEFKILIFDPITNVDFADLWYRNRIFSIEKIGESQCLLENILFSLEAKVEVKNCIFEELIHGKDKTFENCLFKEGVILIRNGDTIFKNCIVERELRFVYFDELIKDDNFIELSTLQFKNSKGHTIDIVDFLLKNKMVGADKFMVDDFKITLLKN